ncbi:MAG: RIP metalloprotease RseP [Bacilli bacterium]|nr:RIP metalloprotease RseP [Bacilli bacterium]
MGFLMTVLYILLFLVCLSVLIVIHELGHLTAAKIFKVYCLEFSVGMGPLLWKHKRKGGETQFSLRAIPFGGYVSMYGEGVELPEGVEVDASRSLHGIKKWKQAIILVAGVTMNAVLALVVFFIGNIACEQHSFTYINEVSVVDDSIIANAGIQSHDYLSLASDEIWNDVDEFGNINSCMLMEVGTVTFNDDSTKDARVALVPNRSFKNPVYSYVLYGCNDDENHTVIQTVKYVDNIKSLSINLKTKDKENKENHFDHPVVINFEDGKMPDCGLRINVEDYRYSFGEAIGQSFKDFGRSATAVVDGLGSLVTGKVGVDKMSGIVGIGFEAKTILDELGVATFIYLWGLISVNLAIFNLLPFPGLDGWQLLVLIIEGITHKKIPDKAKNIVSFIGLIILLGFMAFILFKDIWVYIFQGFLVGIL